jgi:glycosyltransferase involved in cell wall biosynthesis
MIPDISVVMPVYNGQEFLNKAIESILGQSFNNFEFIIVDDGSTDKSKEIIHSYNDKRIRILEQKNSGVAIALNNGIKVSRSGFIARMDSDDIAFHERLDLQFSFLKSNPDYILVGSNTMVVDRNGDVVYKSNLPLTWDEIKLRLPDPSFFHSSVMFRKSSFDKAGGYPEEISCFNCFEDSLLWNKMKDIGKMANIEQPLIYYRLTPGAATAKSGKEAALFKKVYYDIIAENKLSEENIKILSEIKKNIDLSERQRIYHLHIAKKYLWNNHQPQKARRNILQAIKIKPFRINTIILLLLTYIPKSILNKIYRMNKTGVG